MHLEPLLPFLMGAGGGFTVPVTVRSPGEGLRGRRELTDGTNGFVEDGLETFLGERRALEVFDGTNLPRHIHTLRVLDRRHPTTET